MTREKLEAYHDLMKDIAVKEEYIRIFKERSGEVASPCLDGLPHGSEVGNPTMKYAIEAADLEARLEYQKRQAEEQRGDVQSFIDEIDDDITRLVFKLRVMHGYSWQDVADTLGGYNTKGSVRSRYIQHMKKNLTEWRKAENIKDESADDEIREAYPTAEIT